MSRYAVLLRGVNVGGHGKLAMADFRAALEAAGYTEVATYLNSGNATLSAAGRTTVATVARAVAAELGKVADKPPGVLVRSHAQLARVVAGNPYPDDDPKWLHVLFCDPDPVSTAAVPADKLGQDAFTLGPGCAYLHFVTSPGRSRLAELVTKAALPDGGVATARNWNTLLALTERTA
jgi:uncharacterized protein (DUF1697 family)